MLTQLVVALSGRSAMLHHQRQRVWKEAPKAVTHGAAAAAERHQAGTWAGTWVGTRIDTRVGTHVGRWVACGQGRHMGRHMAIDTTVDTQAGRHAAHSPQAEQHEPRTLTDRTMQGRAHKSRHWRDCEGGRRRGPWWSSCWPPGRSESNPRAA
eukprot:361354-Chlamydomonas_euryale.AAC.8